MRRKKSRDLGCPKQATTADEPRINQRVLAQLLSLQRHIQSREFGRALKEIDVLIGEDPDSSFFKMKKIMILLDMEDFKGAHQEIKSNLEKEPETSNAYAYCLIFEVVALQREGKISAAKNRILEVTAHIKKMPEKTKKQAIDKKNVLHRARELREELDRLY